MPVAGRMVELVGEVLGAVLGAASPIGAVSGCAVVTSSFQFNICFNPFVGLLASFALFKTRITRSHGASRTNDFSFRQGRARCDA